MFEIKRFLPCAALRGYIDTYYLVEVACPEGQSLEDIMLPELPNVRFQLGGTWDICFGSGFERAAENSVFGFTHAPYKVRMAGQARVFGAGLKPLGWQALFGNSAPAYSDKTRPLADAMGKPEGVAATASALKECSDGTAMAETLDAFFLACVGTVPASTRSMLHAFENILELTEDGPMTRVSELAETLDLSVRQTERWSRQLYGCGPKLLLRKHRFLSMLARHGSEGAAQAWLDAADETFYDQSHYIREYKRFTGRSPGQYAQDPSALQRTVTATLRDVRGRTPSQVALKLDIAAKGDTACA